MGCVKQTAGLPRTPAPGRWVARARGGSKHRPPRSRAKSHPTAATKIEVTAPAVQSEARPRPNPTFLQTASAGASFFELLLTTRAASGSSGLSERPSALHIDLSSIGSPGSSNNKRCTASHYGLGKIQVSNGHCQNGVWTCLGEAIDKGLQRLFQLFVPRIWPSGNRMATGAQDSPVMLSSDRFGMNQRTMDFSRQGPRPSSDQRPVDLHGPPLHRRMGGWVDGRVGHGLGDPALFPDHPFGPYVLFLCKTNRMWVRHVPPWGASDVLV